MPDLIASKDGQCCGIKRQWVAPEPATWEFIYISLQIQAGHVWSAEVTGSRCSFLLFLEDSVVHFEHYSRRYLLPIPDEDEINKL
jgi:hypothetical protein